MEHEAHPIEALREARDWHEEQRPPHEEQRDKAPPQHYGADSEAKKLLRHGSEENVRPTIQRMQRRRAALWNRSCTV